MRRDIENGEKGEDAEEEERERVVGQVFAARAVVRELEHGEGQLLVLHGETRVKVTHELHQALVSNRGESKMERKGDDNMTFGSQKEWAAYGQE